MKIAMAKGTAAVGTATNVGEGGFLPEAREHARHLILQYHAGKWTKEPEILRQADAIEIHIGQGATATAASLIPPQYVQGRAREIMGLNPGETAELLSRLKEINKPTDLQVLVQNLRRITGGVPIGVKICASHRLEEDLNIIVKSGVDFISLDGGQAGTKGGPPILEDDFGLPTIYALPRTVKFMEKKRLKSQISLLVGGGFFTPGECLKAVALGADAVFMGTAALWAMTHTQVTKTLPYEPQTQLVMHWGQMKDEFDEEEAADHLRNFLNAFVEEMKVAALALGKTSIRSVNANDLVSLDEQTSQVTQIPLANDSHVNPLSAVDTQDDTSAHAKEADLLKRIFQKIRKNK